MAPVTQGSAALNYADSVNLCAAVAPGECVVLETDTGVYALSPADSQGFVDALQERYRLGGKRQVETLRTATCVFFTSGAPHACTSGELGGCRKN